MAHNIVKDYVEHDRKNIKEYIDIITEKKLVGKICEMIVDTYINVRYYDMYERVKKNPIDNIENYVIENYKKKISDKNKEKNVPYIIDALVVLRYVILYERYNKDEKVQKQLNDFEDKLKNKYSDKKTVVNGLIKLIKENTYKKEKTLNGLLSNDFSATKKDTNIKNVFDMVFDNSIVIPDLFSEIAIDRVYNKGVISEDKMMVFYLLTTREIAVDMEEFNYDNKYLIDFTPSLIDKKNKLKSLFKVFDLDYLKDRMILKVRYTDYLEKKDDFDDLIHDGYSLAVIVNDSVGDNKTLLKIFTYIILENDMYKKELREFDNIILLK